ncbi:hypothetical protein PVT67_02920 [Gallaecimonas kandeliae]|uniref:hypothetical protein n=1 Tax=Gallaecimonas kandeliae TaxID=3029055 RepID=UPI0026483C04|nr:hypothetical protein [Gallaecimonas kandeliae]WKE66215.1 hypothetical protein PVT67_02920 [Gallaecimonas kandeliae]
MSWKSTGLDQLWPLLLYWGRLFKEDQMLKQYSFFLGAVLLAAVAWPLSAAGLDDAQQAMARQADAMTASLLGRLEKANTGRNREPKIAELVPVDYMPCACDFLVWSEPEEPRYPVSYSLHYLGRLEEWTPIAGPAEVHEIWGVGKAE